MDHYCHFHPNSPAKWRCNECYRFYDNACLPQCNEKLHQASCPFCHKSLSFLPAETASTKEVYPAKRLVLDSLNSKNIGLIFISVCVSILISFLEINDILKVLAYLCFSLFLPCHFSRESAYFKHRFQQTGKRQTLYRRKQRSSSFSMLSVSTSIQLTLASILLLILPVYIFYSLHWFSGIVLLITAGASFPYLIIFSLHSNDNERSVSLSKLFAGLKPYIPTLSLTSLGLYWLTLFISNLIANFYPPIIAISVSAALSILSCIMVINLSSKVFILAERKLFAKAPKPESQSGPTSIYNSEDISSLDTDIDQALKTGEYDRVISLLEEALKRNSSSNLRRQQLFLLLYELQDMNKLSRYAELFLDWMLERNRIKEASQFIYSLRKHDPTFLLHHLNLISSLAKQFLRAKKYALVLWLAEDAKTRHSPCEALASLYLSASQALITHFKDLEKAEEYLLFILQACNEYPSCEAAKALLIHLQNNQKRQEDLRH